MRHVKQYDDKDVFMPNTSNKQYWVFFNNIQDDFTDQKLKVKSLLKFLYIKDYHFIFDAVWAQNYTYNRRDYKIGEKSSEYDLSGDGLIYHQEIGNLRVALPEEIDQYILLTNSTKYNL